MLGASPGVCGANLLDVGLSNGGNGGKETELFGRILRRLAYDRHVQAAGGGQRIGRTGAAKVQILLS